MAIVVPGHVDLVVASVGPDTPCAPEPSPEAEFALFDQHSREDQRAVGDAVVAPELLPDAVHVDRERLAYARRQRDPCLVHAARHDRIRSRALYPARAAVSVPYRIRRSDRARRIRVSVGNDGQVEVVLPRRSPERHAEEAVEQLGAVDRAAPARGRARGRRTWGARAGTVPYLGETLRLVPEPGRERVHRRGDALLVPAHDPERGARALVPAPARAEVAAAAGRGDRPRRARRYTGLTIRGQRTRWASRSSSGGMSFNWRLLLAPPEILDYVVEHEVAHIEVMDHSPRFWRLLASRSPRLAQHAAWLKRYGSTLTSDDGHAREAGARAAARRRSELSPGRGSIAARRIRPVQATIEPSPRTSTPARTPGPLSSIRGRDQVAGLVPAADALDRPRVAAPCGRAVSSSVERLVQRLALARARPSVRGGPSRGSSPHLGEQRLDAVPARDLAAVGARERRVDRPCRGSCP